MILFDLGVFDEFLSGNQVKLAGRDHVLDKVNSPHHLFHPLPIDFYVPQQKKCQVFTENFSPKIKNKAKVLHKILPSNFSDN